MIKERKGKKKTVSWNLEKLDEEGGSQWRWGLEEIRAREGKRGKKEIERITSRYHNR